jgi:cytochrome P450
MVGLDAGAAHPWIVLCVALAAYVVKRLYLDWFYLDHWRRIPGPPRQHPLFGNWRELVQDGSPLQVGIQWRQKYGPVVRMACAWGRTRLVISDKRALRHIMTEHAYEYPKPDDSRRELAFVVGDGLLSSEGDVHRKQKRILGPVFSAYRTDRLGPLFLSLSARFAKVLLDLTRTGPTEADMCPLMSRFTLDVIGLAGFGEDLKCISGQGSAFAHSVHTLLQGEPVK